VCYVNSKERSIGSASVTRVHDVIRQIKWLGLSARLLSALKFPLDVIFKYSENQISSITFSPKGTGYCNFYCSCHRERGFMISTLSSCYQLLILLKATISLLTL